MNRSLATRLSLALLPALAAGALPGCVADGPQPPERPDPRRISIPQGLTVERIVLAAQQFPTDVDNNGFVDTFPVSVFLFPRPDQFELPIYADGSMRIELIDRDERVLYLWLFDRQEVARARITPMTGPGHKFQLSLLDSGTDRTRPMRAQRRVTFIPIEGDPVEAKGRPTVNIGPTDSR